MIFFILAFLKNTASAVDVNQINWSTSTVHEAVCPGAVPLEEVPKDTETVLSNFLEASPELLQQFLTEDTRHAICNSIRYSWNNNCKKNFFRE